MRWVRVGLVWGVGLLLGREGLLRRVGLSVAWLGREGLSVAWGRGVGLAVYGRVVWTEGLRGAAAQRARDVGGVRGVVSLDAPVVLRVERAVRANVGVGHASVAETEGGR